jgi:hypothetical protein
MSAETITATRDELADAFNEWLRRYDEDPDSFGEYHDSDNYGQGAADCLIELLSE